MRHVFAAQQDPSGVWLLQTGQHAHQYGLSCRRRAVDHRQVTGHGREREVSQHRRAAIGLGDVPHEEYWRVRSPGTRGPYTTVTRGPLLHDRVSHRPSWIRLGVIHTATTMSRAMIAQVSRSSPIDFANFVDGGMLPKAIWRKA